MECSIYISRLSDMLDGEVLERERQAFEEHARTCETCRDERDDLSAMLDGLAALGDEDAPEELRARVMSGVRDIHRRRRTSFFAKVGGCAVAGLLLIAIPVALTGALNGYTGNVYSMNQSAPSAARITTDEKALMMAAGETDTGAYSGSAESGGGAWAEPQMEAYDYGETEMAMPEQAPAEAPAPSPMRDNSGALLSTNAVREVKRIMSASLSLSSKNFDADQQAILNMVSELGGYVESSYSYGLPLDEDPEYGGRTLSLSVRVPSQAFEAFMESVKTIGQLDWSSENAQDITDQYYDTQTRLETLRIQYERLIAILEKTTELKDVLALETEMSRVQYEIESLEGTLRHWDSKISYSSVSIEVREVRKLERVTPVDPTLPERMYEGLIHTMNGIVKFFENALVFIVGALPVIVIIALAAAIVFFALRSSLRGRRVRRKKGDPGKPPEM